MKFFFFMKFSDYESPIFINETDYQQNHQQQQNPYARNGYNFGYRPSLNRAPSKFNRMQNADYGFEVRRSGGGGHGFENENEQQQPQFDYSDDNREANVNFYDNKYYDNLKMHR
jgi:hypothetical protein